jgi:hypothetical protein
MSFSQHAVQANSGPTHYQLLRTRGTPAGSGAPPHRAVRASRIIVVTRRCSDTNDTRDCMINSNVNVVSASGTAVQAECVLSRPRPNGKRKS